MTRLGMLLPMLVLAIVFTTATASAQTGATASTGSQTYGTAGNFLDEYYFDVDFGAGVASCDLSADIAISAATVMTLNMWMVDPLTGLSAVSDQPNYAIGINYGQAGSPASAPGTGGPVILWGPNGLLFTGNFPLSGIVRFIFTVGVDGANTTFPNNINVTWSTSNGTIVPNTSFPTPIGTNMGYHTWSVNSAIPAGLATGYVNVSSSDCFQRNYANMAKGIARFGSATDELQYEIEVDAGSTATTLDIGLYGFAYSQPGSATGQCVFELYDMQAGYDTPVATVTGDIATPGNGGAGYAAYTSVSGSGVMKFRVVVRGQNLQNVSYTSSGVADFGWEVYFTRDADVQTLGSNPAVAAPRMALSPASSTISSTTTVSCTGGTGSPSSYTWSVVSQSGTGLSLSASTNTADIVVGGGATNGETITIRTATGPLTRPA